MNSLLTPTLVGLLLATPLSLAAYRARFLTIDGAVAAVIVGVSCVLGGWKWVTLLLFFFVSSSLLSQWRADTKRALLATVVEKGSRRDAVQVLANGGLFALAAVGAVLGPSDAWSAVGAGAIATATADTWGTEIGTILGGTPRHVVTRLPLPRGASGGITLVGTAGTIFGAASMAALAWTLQFTPSVAAVFGGGVLGAFIDSLLGGTLQERRWCPWCAVITERRVHSCGSVTEVRGGIRGFANDAVNLTSILAGAMITRLWT